MYSVISSNPEARVWFTSGVTSATGALTINLAVNAFTQVLGVQCTPVRNTADPTLACFALVRSYNASQIVIQVFESKTTGMLLGGMAEGMELATSAITVLVTVFGY